MANLTMTRVLLWKEYREHRQVWIAMAAMTVLLMLGLVHLLEPTGLIASTKLPFILAAAYVMVGSYGTVCGAMMMAGERENRTLGMLDYLTTERTPLWTRKLLIGGLFTLLQAGVVSGVLCWLFDFPAGHQRSDKVLLYSALPFGLGLIGLTWGMVFSGFGRNVLAMAAMAGLCFVLTVIPFAGIAVATEDVKSIEPTAWLFAVGGVLVVGSLTWVSWWTCCFDDVRRQPGLARQAVFVLFGFLAAVFFGSILMFIIRLGPEVSERIGTSSQRFIIGLEEILIPIGGILIALYAWLYGSRSLAEGRAARPSAESEKEYWGYWSHQFWRGLAVVLGMVFLLAVLEASLVLTELVWPPLPGHLVHRDASEFVKFLLVGSVALELLAWGMYFSAYRESAAWAALLTLLTVIVIWGISSLIWAITEMYDAMGGLWIANTLRAVLALAALRGSWLVFSRRSHPLAARLAASLSASAELVVPRTWRPLAWLTWMQANPIVKVLGALTIFWIIVNLMVPAYQVVLAWPALTLLIGVTCGTGVFAGEQIWGCARFLGDQRVPAGRLWTAKTAIWFVIALVATCMCMVGPLLREMVVWLDRAEGRSLQESDMVGLFFPSPGGILHFLVCWLIYGFCVAQFVTLTVKKTAVAPLISLMVSLLFLAAWWPSLVAGGVSALQLYFVPVLLLVASRLSLWSWMSGTLQMRRPAALVVACWVAAAGWVAGGLWYRVAEVPDVGEPFDVAAFLETIPGPEENQAGMLIRSAATELRQPGQSPFDPPGTRAAQQSPRDEPDTIRIAEVAEKGWPKDDANLGLLLDRTFDRSKSLNELRKIPDLPLGVIDHPTVVSPAAPKYLDAAGQSGDLFRARALQLSAQSAHDPAFEHLRIALALSRNMANKALPYAYYAGRYQSRRTVRAIELWLSNLGPKRDLIRRTIDELAKHEAEFPPPIDSVKASYVWLQNSSVLPENLLTAHVSPADRFRSTKGGLFTLALQVPWERERQRRIFNLVSAGLLRAATLGELSISWPAEQQHPSQLYGLSRGQMLLRQAGWVPAPDGPDLLQVGRLLDSSWLSFHIPFHIITWRDHTELATVRGVRLVLALACYQADHKSAAESLSDLVPDYVPSIPTDPFTGQPFRYRVSKGERILRSPGKEPPQYDQVLDGQGVVWSPGPDSKPGRGLERAHSDFSPDARRDDDLIFVVPKW